MNYLKFYKVSTGNPIRFLEGGTISSYSPQDLATFREWASRLKINTSGNDLTDDLLNSLRSNARFRAFHPELATTPDQMESLKTSADALIYRNQYSQYANLSDAQVLQMKQLNEEADEEEGLMNQLNLELSALKTQADIERMHLEDPMLDQKVADLKARGVIPPDKPVSSGGTNTPLTDAELPQSTGPQYNKTLANYATAAAGTIAGLVGGLSAAESVNMVSTVAQNPEMAGTGAGKAAMGLGTISAAANMVDKAVMGDKNFGAQSAAIDTAVHGVSGALMKSGNPYAMAAGAALEVGNFLTKAGGQTVQGFDVDINSSGYGNMGHKESSSSRDFGAMLGLGGLNAAATQRKLKRRNEEAQMALKAANIADTTKFEQEARMNSVDDVIQQNEIALQGGIDTSLLAARHGAKIQRKIESTYNSDWEEIKNSLVSKPVEIVKAQNGAKLEQIEVSEESNVIPSGAMHKNKNHLDLDITEKGIPVITVEDDSAETFEEIKEQEDTLVQHAEVEEAEIIFNKELTIFIENLRKQWHEKDKKDDNICLEAGMRLAKEIIENTEDNADVTEKSMEAVKNEEN